MKLAHVLLLTVIKTHFVNAQEDAGGNATELKADFFESVQFTVDLGKYGLRAKSCPMASSVRPTEQ